MQDLGSPYCSTDAAAGWFAPRLGCCWWLTKFSGSSTLGNFNVAALRRSRSPFEGAPSSPLLPASDPISAAKAAWGRGRADYQRPTPSVEYSTCCLPFLAQCAAVSQAEHRGVPQCAPRSDMNSRRTQRNNANKRNTANSKNNCKLSGAAKRRRQRF